MKTLDEALFMNILKGRFENLPKDRSRVVRIFLSSTFSGILNEIYLKLIMII
jgi:hypothetical protein